MPTLQKTIDSPGAKFRPLSVGKGADLSAVRQNLATQHHVAPGSHWIWRDRRGVFIDCSAALAPGARRGHSGTAVVAAAVCVHRLARNICVAGQFSVEMRIA